MAKKAPEIRFSGFNDDWEQRKLGSLAQSFEYGLNASATNYDGKNKYIRITDIDDESRRFSRANLTSPDADLSKATNYLLKEGDLLFARTGASVGKSYIYNSTDGIVYFAGFLIRARINAGYDSNFIFQNTLTSKYDNFIKITSQRSGQPGVNAQEYASYLLMVPEEEEQIEIGKFFETFDKTIALHQRKVNALQQLKKGFLQKMFPTGQEKVPQIRFANFADDWEQRKLGKESIIVVGGDVEKTKLLKSGKYPVLANALTNDGIIGYYDENYRIKAPAVTVTGRGDVGIAKARMFNFTPVVRLLGVKSDHDVNFLEAAINNHRKIVESTGVPQLTAPQLSNYNIFFPTPQEEHKIGAILQQIGEIIALHQQKIEQIQIVKNGLLQKMFI